MCYNIRVARSYKKNERGFTMKGFVCIGNNNSKLGQSIPNINLPAGLTCRENAPCKKGCYACKGNFQFPSVKASILNNYNAFNFNSELYFNDIAERTVLNKFVRWHSSGDIINIDYFAGMCKVARKNKGTYYLAFTKKFEIVNSYIASGHKIPKNLTIVFSNWGDFKCENPYNLPVSYVRFDKDTVIPQNAVQCNGSCSTCQYCWKMKSGQIVVFDKH